VLQLELKFGAPLTSNQPMGYLDRFVAGQPGLLLFIVPTNRRTSLWNEIKARVTGSDGVAADRVLDDGTLTTPVSATHAVAITTWQALLQRLRSSVSAEEGAARADLAQIGGMYQVMDEALAYQPLAADDLDARHASALFSIHDLLEALRQRAVYDTTSPLHRHFSGPGRWRGTYPKWGYTLTVNGLDASLHVDLEKWRDFEVSPLWLSFSCATQAELDRLSDVLGGEPHGFFDDYCNAARYAGAVAIPLIIPSDTAHADAVDSLAAQLLRVCAATAPPAPPPAARRRPRTS
jgi:hypothetical protein